jgi:hypothetical protein
MRSSCSLYVFFVPVCPPYCLKAGIVEPGDEAVAMQRLGKHFPAATNTQKTLEK